MGSWWSLPSVASTTTIRVAVVGHTETGKSHFVSHVSGDVDTATKWPTYGIYTGTIAYGGYKLEFNEIGFLAAPTASVEPYDCVMWFIDSHDSVEDILDMRNYVISMAMAEQQPLSKKQKQHQPPPTFDKLMETSSGGDGGRVPLCIVHNHGRPFWRRDEISRERRWITGDPQTRLPLQKPVEWGDLRRTCQIEHLELLYSAIAAMQLSYTDPDAPRLLFDWIISKTLGR